MTDETIDPANFEVYMDRTLYWRWRLTATNGNIVADGGQAYSTRPHCRRAVLRFKAVVASASTVTDASPVPAKLALFVVYLDKALDWRWRLTTANGNIVADGGQGYSTKATCQRAVTRFSAIVAAATFVAMPLPGAK